jgi:hypothetical protein
MASPKLPLLFFRPSPGTDPLAVGRSLAAGEPSGVEPIEPERLLGGLKLTRGFSRLRAPLPTFELDDPRRQAALHGIASVTHLSVGFFGDFDRLAGPLIKALTRLGLMCYSRWDDKVIRELAVLEQPHIDKGFAVRMTEVLRRRSLDLAQTVADPKDRAKQIDVYVRGAEFRAEMGKAARREQASGDPGRKSYDHHVNCFVRWRTGRPSVAEMAGLRKLDAKFASMPVGALRELAAQGSRLLLATALSPGQAKALRTLAAGLGFLVDEEQL